MAVAAVALTLRAGVAGAQSADPCIGDGMGVEAKGDAFDSLRLMDHLETAWLANDSTAALELFTDDAVAASSSGKRWQGQVELADFLSELWDPSQSGEHQRIETLNRCAIGDRAVWLFRYPTFYAIGSADIVLRGGRISHVFWQFVPSAIGPSDADSDRTQIDPGLHTGPPLGGIMFGAVLVGIAALVFRWYRLKDNHQRCSTGDPE
jgi:uncharacterized protein (TIGR02246 family)